MMEMESANRKAVSAYFTSKQSRKAKAKRQYLLTLQASRGKRPKPKGSICLLYKLAEPKGQSQKAVSAYFTSKQSQKAKAKRQYLLTLQASRAERPKPKGSICLLYKQAEPKGQSQKAASSYFTSKQSQKAKRQYLLTSRVSRYCLLALTLICSIQNGRIHSAGDVW